MNIPNVLLSALDGYVDYFTPQHIGGRYTLPSHHARPPSQAEKKRQDRLVRGPRPGMGTCEGQLGAQDGAHPGARGDVGARAPRAVT